MASNAMTVLGLLPLSCSLSERPPVTLTTAALKALQEELEAARLDWLRALVNIPDKWGARRTNAINKCLRLKKRYEELLGHPVGVTPMDAKA